MRRRYWGRSNGSRRGTAPFGLGLGRRGSLIGRGLLSEGVSLAALSLAVGAIGACGAMSSARAATLNLNGTTVTLPDNTLPPVFTTPFLTGANDVTNLGSAPGTLFEGGGPAGTTYSGTISDGKSSAQRPGFTQAAT